MINEDTIICCYYIFNGTIREMDKIYQQIGLRIRNARKQRKLSQVELGKLTKLDQGFISRLESGTFGGSPLDLKKIANALNVLVSDLLGEANTPKIIQNQSLSVRNILTDEDMPEGLYALASDDNLTAALSITDKEWYTLSSINLPTPISKDAYVQLLTAIRAALATSSVTKT